MPRSKEIPEEMRKKVVEIHKSGKGYKAISQALGLKRTTVRAIVCKWKTLGTVVNLPRSGRPAKITGRVQRPLLKQAAKDPRNTSNELQALIASAKEALQVQGQRLNRRISRSEKFLQLRADAERDSQRFVEGAEQQVQVVGGQVQGQLGLFLSALRECVRAHSGAGPGAELQRCGGRMAEDRAQLQQAQSSLQALLQQNDPFLFVQEYHSTGKMLRRALKRPLSSPGSVCLDREALVEAMEAKLEEFQTEFRLQISDLIHTVGLLNTAPQDGGREEEEGESEDEDEDGDPVDEIRSEGDEEDDHNQSADGLCKPEEEEKEEDMSSD
ncbi:uncharacterized protein LOC133134777 [Conger conger]|uniref:uncharacterized protein LOC133134777 n=1 Tax=Conger conger TaxID=82655 RepID=UPI002A59C469|nr:uncharacterized protein LOC133134777 [Conger conger]